MDTNLNWEVGRLGGLLQGVAEQIESTADQLVRVSDQVHELHVMVESKNQQIEDMAGKIVKMEVQINGLVALRNKFGGMACAMAIVGAWLLNYTGLPALMNRLFSGHS